ncbi:hypothetical protein, partial [Bartonella sp. AP58NXGY]|uniref:hypothetical protein n=1 Tax=Bartonella sp. AP58NXGY TaxID=3243498 RepID=UPI0035CECBAB
RKPYSPFSPIPCLHSPLPHHSHSLHPTILPTTVILLTKRTHLGTTVPRFYDFDYSQKTVESQYHLKTTDLIPFQTIANVKHSAP